MTPDPRVSLTRPQLVTLVREHLLAGHLMDRAGMPALLEHLGREEMAQVAIEEWRGASPVYTRRMQQVLGFQGDDVTTIFKGMQLDIGAPPQFLDFRYQVTDRDHGEFWLDHCGALMDVEPMGEEFVVSMCHDIEDPTFPATACATNPRARVEPIHRPPRIPADRHPHCHWKVTIDPSDEPASEPVEALALMETGAAQLPVAAPEGAEVVGSDGRRLYDGPLEADLDLSAFDPRVLRAIDDEVCLQGHLLSLSFAAAARRRLGDEASAAATRAQLTGVGGVVAARLRDALGCGRGLDGVASVLALHPAFLPRSYVDLRLGPGQAGRVGDESSLRVAIAACPSLDEPGAQGWITLLAAEPTTTGALDAIVGGVDPRARCAAVEAGPDERVAWEVTLAAEPSPEPAPVTITRFSTGASFEFEER